MSMAKSSIRGFIVSGALIVGLSVVLMGMHVRPAAAQSCEGDCPPPSCDGLEGACSCDGPCPPPPAAVAPPPVTGAGSSATSIGGLVDQRTNQMITNRVLGTVLLGVNEQINCSDCISVFGSAGSFSAGIHGRKEITPNLSLLAGIAYTQYSEGGYHVTSAPMGAFAL